MFDVRFYGPVAVEAVLVGCALFVFRFFGSCVVNGSSDDIHVLCEDRINLYPAVFLSEFTENQFKIAGNLLSA